MEEDMARYLIEENAPFPARISMVALNTSLEKQVQS